jgi:hypothetical protein
MQFIENNRNLINNQVTEIIINDDDYDNEFDNSYLDEMNEIAIQEFNNNIENLNTELNNNMINNTNDYRNQPPQFTEPLDERTIVANQPSRFSRTDYPWSQQVEDVLHNQFNLPSFRPNQLEAINATLCGHDCFILMIVKKLFCNIFNLSRLVEERAYVICYPLLLIVEKHLV